jgi:6-phosphogluconolactonase
MQIHKPQVYDCVSQSSFVNVVSDHLVKLILDANSEYGAVRLALSGGSSPIPILESLQHNVILPWEKLNLYLTDERYTEATAKESNQRAIKQALSDDVVEQLGSFNSVQTELPLDMAVSTYGEVLSQEEGVLFDAVILGVGPDGHIASLFPGGDYYASNPNKVISTVAPIDFAIPRRVSLSIETILDSNEIILLISGKGKENILNEMLEGNLTATNFPVKFLLAHPRLTIYHYIENQD